MTWLWEGAQHLSDTIRRGVTYVTQKWKGGGVIKFFPVIQNNFPAPPGDK